MKTELVDAVRTVGQLLLHHPTTREAARNKYGHPVDVTAKSACKFCYVGAVDAVCHNLKVTWWQLDRACDNVLVGPDKSFAPFDWDRGTREQRKEWATKLANYTGE